MTTKRNRKPPHSPAYGGVVALTVIASALVILTYTMLPLPGQRELGWLNYAIAVSFLVLTLALMKNFRPAAASDEDPTARPRVRSR